MMLKEGSAGGVAPSGVARAEIGPVGGGAVGEVVQPKGQHHLLLLLRQRPYYLFQYSLDLRPLRHAQHGCIRAVVGAAQQGKPRHQHLHLRRSNLLFIFSLAQFFCLSDQECCTK